MLAEGWEGVFDHSQVKEKLKTASQWLRKSLRNQGFSNEESLIHNIERLTAGFEPSTRFDLPFTTQIFEPCLRKIEQAAKKIGLKPTRPVHLATSTGIGPSPLARPSSGSHLLFIGLGTSVFCNYWAKAYTAVVKAIAHHDPKTRVVSPDDLKPALASDPSGIALAGRLALHYAVYGTLLGFGKVDQPRGFLLERSLLLDAMEMFVVSHEFGHFVAEERIPAYQGTLIPEKARELEVLCDQFGIALSRNASEDNFFTFAGVGAIALFRAVELCETTRETLFNLRGSGVIPSTRTDEHPAVNHRIKLLKERVLETTADDQRCCFGKHAGAVKTARAPDRGARVPIRPGGVRSGGLRSAGIKGRERLLVIPG